VYWRGHVTPGAQKLAESVEHVQPLGSFVQVLDEGKPIAARKEWHDYQGRTGLHGCFIGTSLFQPAAPASQPV
jgi:hypothetical protein